MNKRLPYEEEIAKQLENIPLPGENEAWADMKRRLDEDDDDRVFPFWLNGCLGWSLLGVIVLIVGWWIIRPEKWFEKKDVAINKTMPVSRSKEKDQNNSLREKQIQQDSSVFFKTTSSPQSDKIKNHKKETPKGTRGKKDAINSGGSENATTQSRDKIKKKRTAQSTTHEDVLKNKNSMATATQDDSHKTDLAALQNQTVAPDSSRRTAQQHMETAKNNIGKNEKDSLPGNKLSKKEKSDSAKSLKFSFSAGLSLHQQLPIDGQSFVPYNREGRKGTLADYIPSVYFRMYRGNKWFIQSEFRYGAPQYTKEFLYQQRTDSAFNGTITQSTSLKKTYYHQLPLTFNYFLSKNLSAGGGIVWNKFASAISSQDIIHHNSLTGTDSVISKGTILVTKTPDSSNVFKKSYFQAQVEAQYRWQRFSIGVKYAFGLEPYIKFELQPGAPQQEKNSAVDIFMRYELWRSKKK
jgi:hypothetical protein